MTPEEMRLGIVNIVASHYIHYSRDDIPNAGIPEDGGAKFLETCRAIEKFVTDTEQHEIEKTK